MSDIGVRAITDARGPPTVESLHVSGMPGPARERPREGFSMRRSPAVTLLVAGGRVISSVIVRTR